jgi:hypothetical protein
MSITHLQIEHGSRFKTQHWPPRLECVNLWEEVVFLPIDILEALF